MKKIFWLSLVILSGVWAGQGDLQSKIARLQTLPKSERFKLMNEIKRELAQMNEAQRKEALGKLRASIHGGKRAGKGKGIEYAKGLHIDESNGKYLHQNMQRGKDHQHNSSPKRPGNNFPSKHGR